MAPTPKPVDLRLLRRWLEGGYTLKEISVFFELSISGLRRRIKKHLPPEVAEELAVLSRRNSQYKRRGGPPVCGTLRGYYSHKHKGELACQACLDEFAADRRRHRGRRSLSEAAKANYHSNPDHPFRRANEQRRARAQQARAQQADREEAA